MDPLVSLLMPFRKSFQFVWVVFLFFSINSQSQTARTDPVLEIGTVKFSGTEGKSLRGATGYSVAFRSEADRGRFRSQVAAQFDYSTGQASVSTSDLAYTLYGGNFVPAYSFYFFREGFFQPFFTAGGIVGWDFIQLTDPPTGTEPYTQGFSYGYELSTGVDIRLRRNNDSKALRLKTSFWFVQGQVAGLTGFQLSGFKFAVGLVF